MAGAYHEALETISAPASTDLSSSQFRFMVRNSSGQLEAPSAGVAVDGCLQDKPDAAGRVGSLAIAGVTKAEAGGAVTNGDDVTVDSSGRVVIAGTGDVKCGTAWATASGTGSVIPVLIKLQTEPVS